MMHPSQAIKTVDTGHQLHIGPLCYGLVPHDRWGNAVLARIERHLQQREEPFCGYDRIVHLCRPPVATSPSASGPLPQGLRTLLPSHLADLDWQLQSNGMNAVWVTPQTRHALWTDTADPELGEFRFDLPWSLLLNDIIDRGGGLIHGGLVRRNGSGFLFLAPPGGGKTTTVGTAPAGWQVLADDAAVVWPHDQATWLASPMPTWSALIGTSPQPPTAIRLAAGTSTPLRNLLMLRKADAVSLEELTPLAATPLLYRALREYPASFLAGSQYRENLFRIAARMARQLPSRRLALPKHADIWPLLDAPAETPHHDRLP